MSLCSSEKCGFYGSCIDNQCVCYSNYFSGEECNRFNPIAQHPLAFRVMQATMLSIFVPIWILSITQSAFRIRCRLWKLSIPNICWSIIVVWSTLSILDSAQTPYSWTRLEDRSKIAFKVWLELVCQDFLIAAVGMIIFAWFDIVQVILQRLGAKERKFVHVVKPTVVFLVAVLFIVEITTVTTIPKVYSEYVWLKRYWLVLGFDSIVFSVFLAVYGLRILSFLKHAMSKELESRGARVSRMLVILGFTAFLTLLIILFYQIIQQDLADEFWFAHIILSRFAQLLAVAALISVMRDEIFLYALQKKYWIYPSLITIKSTVREIPATSIESESSNNCSSSQSV